MHQALHLAPKQILCTRFYTGSTKVPSGIFCLGVWGLCVQFNCLPFEEPAIKATIHGQHDVSRGRLAVECRREDPSSTVLAAA